MEKTIDDLLKTSQIKFWECIIEIMSQHGYRSGIDRPTERVKATGEVFTPTHLVIEVLKKLPLHEVRPTKTVLDPSCGDGQFILGAILIKMALRQLEDSSILSSSEAMRQAKLQALNEVYGVDIMFDNVQLARERILKVLGLLGDKDAEMIVKNNILTGNTLNPEDPVTGHDAERMSELFMDNPSLKLESTAQRRAF